eukprot:SAG31_NODE_13763_length_848_cov_1.173565_1_plen_246_part_10
MRCQRLILNQIRWLDRLVEGDTFVQNLMSMLDSISVELQREIVSALPEIIDDHQHDAVVTHLQELMQGNPTTFMSPVLDALTNLNLSDNLMAKVHGFVLPRLSSVELSALPLLIKFLLFTANDSLAPHVVDGIRALNVVGLSDCEGTGPDAGSQSTAETLLVESLRSGLRSNRQVTECFLTTIQKSEKHSAIDLWMLILQHSLPGYRAKIESAIKKKMQNGSIGADVVRKALQSSNGALRSYFQSC